MNADRFIMAIQALSHRCNYELTEFDFELYSECAEKMGYELAIAAVKAIYRECQAGARFPSIAELEQRANPAGLSDEDQGREAAALISDAIQRYGYNRPDDAKALIGTLGWRIVEMSGGWTRICEELTFDNMPTLKAQWRELAVGQLRKAKAGIAEGPALPQSKPITLISELASAVAMTTKTDK